jgi:O-antigen ligase
MHQIRGIDVRAALAWAGVGLVFVMGMTAAVVATSANMVIGAVAAGAAALCAWLVVPARANSTPKWFTLFLLALIFSTALPSFASYGVQFLALAGGFAYWLRLPKAERRGSAVVGWAALIIAFWVLLIVHPNVPDIEVGILGFRKTVLCVAGVVAGASISKALIPAVERTVIKLLTFAMTVSIALHLFAPGVEASIGRSAGEYTALYGGEARLQGIFAGPFHVALGCLLLIGWGLVRIKSQRLLAATALTIGIIGMYLSLVRTAYVAVALVLIVIIFMAPTFNRFVVQVSSVALLLVVGGAILVTVNPSALAVVDSVAEFSSDSRFQGRFPGYEYGIQLVQQSPLFGWGSGSAGDTLEGYFFGAYHVTSHNIILKILVEGGLIGLTLWGAFFVSMMRRMSRSNPRTVVAAASLAAIIGMGMTVASLETLPLSYLAFFLVGLALEHAPVRRVKAPAERKLQNGLTVPMHHTLAPTRRY